MLMADEDAATFLQQHQRKDTRSRARGRIHLRSKDEVVRHTYAWNNRKRQFTPRQIGLAADVLIDKGWSAAVLMGN